MGRPAVDLNSSPPPKLRDLIEEAARTGEVLVTSGGEEVAKIIPLHRARPPRRPGSAAGLIHMADDFDATPDDFKDYV